MAGPAVARHRNDMMWLSQHGVVGTASRQVPDVCKQIVYGCRTPRGGGGHFYTWEYWGCAAGQGAFFELPEWGQGAF